MIAVCLPMAVCSRQMTPLQTQQTQLLILPPKIIQMVLILLIQLLTPRQIMTQLLIMIQLQIMIQLLIMTPHIKMILSHRIIPITIPALIPLFQMYLPPLPPVTDPNSPMSGANSVLCLTRLISLFITQMLMGPLISFLILKWLRMHFILIICPLLKRVVQKSYWVHGQMILGLLSFNRMIYTHFPWLTSHLHHKTLISRFILITSQLIKDGTQWIWWENQALPVNS